MSTRKAGRPKAEHPRDNRVMVRLTDDELEGLSQMQQPGEPLAATIRWCIQAVSRSYRKWKCGSWSA